MTIDEKNERVRDTVRKKVVEYMARAEKIKEHLAKLEEKPKKKALANSSNGKGGKYVPSVSFRLQADHQPVAVESASVGATIDIKPW